MDCLKAGCLAHCSVALWEDTSVGHWEALTAEWWDVSWGPRSVEYSDKRMGVATAVCSVVLSEWRLAGPRGQQRAAHSAWNSVVLKARLWAVWTGESMAARLAWLWAAKRVIQLAAWWETHLEPLSAVPMAHCLAAQSALTKAASWEHWWVGHWVWQMAGWSAPLTAAQSAATRAKPKVAELGGRWV